MLTSPSTNVAGSGTGSTKVRTNGSLAGTGHVSASAPVPRLIKVGNRTITVVVSEVARATNLSIAHVSRVFGGKRNPSMRTAKKIAQHLRVSLDQLYTALGLQ